MLQVVVLFLVCSGAPFTPTQPGQVAPAEICTQENAKQYFTAQMSDRACTVYRIGNEIEREAYVARNFHYNAADDEHVLTVCP
jgi:hypothetical protein